MQPAFPFSAIVGQDALKRALVLGVVQPALGGVLIRGTKGVAKSTAVRALAALLPPIETLAGCPFQRAPGEDVPAWPLAPDVAVVRRAVPLVELPLGATEDRVLGTLHLERALRGERSFEPGLLAASHRGLLYIDEVNLLPDHLVDVLLDAAASGVHRIEREGLSLLHPARFVLVGTMNPEEGELRPQLLDRFGLVVDAADLTDSAQRAEAVRRRMQYEAGPAAFAAAWREADTAETERLVRARSLLPSVRMADELLHAISQRCLAEGVEGLRADLTVCRAACAWASYQGRTEVQAEDVEAVIEMALQHRRTRPPRGGGGGSPGQRPPSGNGVGASHASSPQSGQDVVQESAGMFAAKPRPLALDRGGSSGGWRQGIGPRRHAPRGFLRPYEAGAMISWAATVRALALRNLGQSATLAVDDIRAWPRRGPTGCLLLFVLDASGSMAAWQRMRQTKSAVVALLMQAYRRRDHVALLVFRGAGAQVILPRGVGLNAAREALERLPVGGTTPLAHGLAAARRFLDAAQRRQPQRPAWTVVLTDGRTNVARGDGDPWLDALAEAAAWRSRGEDCLVVDTETGRHRLGRAAQLAVALGAACLPVEDVLGRPLLQPRRQPA